MATINLLRLAVGITDMNHLATVQAGRLFQYQGAKATQSWTRRKPTREAELLNGGSLYWVIRNNIMVRQRLIGLDLAETDAGTMCRLILDPQLIRLSPVHKKAFQGWRYLESADAPRDLGIFHPGKSDDELPQALIEELKALGLF